MLNAEQREERKTQIGASEVSKLFNFDTKAAQDLYKEKTGLLEPKELDSKYIQAGNILEEPCISFYLKTHEIKNYAFNERIEHKTIKGFVASLDCRVLDEEKYPLENKTMKLDRFMELKEVPREYVIQCHAQISCADTHTAKLLINTLTEEEVENPLLYVPADFKQHEFIIEKNAELIKEIESRVSYMLWCMRTGWRPTESNYLERKMFSEI
jgi:YqaJ-like viral recombinase domain.